MIRVKNEEFARAVVIQTRFLYYSQEDLITFPLHDEKKLKNVDFYSLICKELEQTNEKNRLIFVKMSNSVMKLIFDEENKYFMRIPKIINGIDLYGEHVEPSSLKILFDGLLLFDNNIIKLDLDSCKIGDDASILISNFIKKSKKISILLLRKNSITEIGMKVLAEGVMQDSCLIDFDIAFNNLGNKGCSYISDVLQKAKNLKKLFISGNGISKQGIEVMYDSIIKHNNLYYISLINNQINDNEAIKLLLDAVMGNKVIKKLNMGYNKFDNDNSKYISEFISNDIKLKKLFLFQLYFNNRESVEMLSKSLMINNSIEYLNCKDSNFSSSFIYFPYFLTCNKTIIRLNLFNNKINDRDITVLVKNLFLNQTLEVLNLGCNNITDVGAIELSSLITSNSSLKDIDISFNRLGSEGSEFIFKGLIRNTKLLFLNLKSNSIVGKSLNNLLIILERYNHSIEYINLKKNDILVNSDDLEDFKKVLMRNKKIKFIGLSNIECSKGYEKLFLKNILRDNFQKNKYDLD